MENIIRKEFHILLVEDSSAEVRLIREAMKDAEIEERVSLDIVHDGKEAIDLLFKNAEEDDSIPNLILLDLNLPRVEGKEILKIVKNHKVLKEIPVYILTNSNNKKDMVDCYNLNADLYFQKPKGFLEFIDFFKEIKRSFLDNSDSSFTYENIGNL